MATNESGINRQKIVYGVHAFAFPLRLSLPARDIWPLVINTVKQFYVSLGFTSRGAGQVPPNTVGLGNTNCVTLV